INDKMPKFIVERTVEQMRSRGLMTANCRVGVLGITFKENFGDLRDSRSQHVVAELQRVGLQPVVHDPLARAAEAKGLYGIELQDWSQLRDLSAVIVAVAHTCFGTLTPAQFREVLVPSGLVIDVKALYHPSMFSGTGIHLWQL